MFATLVIAAALSQVAGAPVFCQSGLRLPYYDPIAQSIVLDQRACDALAAAPRMSRGSDLARRRVGVAIFDLAHEVAHVEQARAGLPFDEFEADCRAAGTFGRYAYAVGVRSRAVMQRMVSFVSAHLGYAPGRTREAGCWGAWQR